MTFTLRARCTALANALQEARSSSTAAIVWGQTRDK
jgi:hypothetical protein